jgi:WD40 repeat protein
MLPPEDRTIRVWDFATGELVRTLVSTNIVYSLSFSRQTLVRGGIRLWDVASPDRKTVLKTDALRRAESFHPLWRVNYAGRVHQDGRHPPPATAPPSESGT